MHHRDHYTAMAALLDAPAGTDYEQRLEQADLEIDNLRAAFSWSRENSDAELALALASSLQPLWQARGRLREGLAWLDAALADPDAQHAEVAAAVRARARADRAGFAMWVGDTDSLSQAQQALAVAREVDDPALLVRALTACGLIAGFVGAELARPYFAEAIGLARELGDQWRMSQILTWQATAAMNAGDTIATRAPAEEGRDLADAIGDRSNSRACRYCLGIAQLFEGDLAAAAQFAEVAAESEAAHDGINEAANLAWQGIALAFQGEPVAARAAADAAIQAAAELGGIFATIADAALVIVALAAGDTATAKDATEAWPHLRALPHVATAQRALSAEAALAGGDLVVASRWADEAVTTATGFYLPRTLSIRARLAITQGEPEPAEHDARDALARAADLGAYLLVPDCLECLAVVAADAGSHHDATRLFGAAQGLRQRMGSVRFKVWDTRYEASVAALRAAMGENDFHTAWAEGAALSVEETIAYAQRGRGQRKRPSAGWASLTPTERDVVRLVSEGWPTRTLPLDYSCPSAPCKPTSPTSTPNSD